METVETIEKRMRRQRIIVRFILIVLVLALCLFIGWIISYSSYDGIQHDVLDMHHLKHLVQGYG